MKDKVCKMSPFLLPNTNRGLFNPLIIVMIVHFSPTCSYSVSKTYKNGLNHNTLLLMLQLLMLLTTGHNLASDTVCFCFFFSAECT